MKLLTLITLCTASLLIISGCSGKGPVPKKEAVVDETLPMVILTKNGTIADTNTIALEWEAIDDQRVNGVYIYKVVLDGNNKSDKGDKDDYYDTVNSRFSTHYLDTKIEPNSKYSYYFKTYSDKAESKKSQITTITSLPQMESVTWIHSRQSMPKSAKIIWRPHVNEKVKAYIVQRRTLQESNWNDVATVNGRLNAEFIDKDLKDNFTYKYRVRVLTFDNIISKPSDEVTVVTKELPSEVTQITASTDLPKKIQINWKHSDTKDFLTYRVYRSKTIDGTYETVTDTKNNSYLDTLEEDGKEHFYRVSVFDKDKLESISKNYTAMGRTLVKPAAPSMVEAKFVDGRVKLSWSNSDSRAKSFIVQKEHKKGFFETKKDDFQNIKSSEFVDSEIEAGETYYYKILSVDANGIKSEPSIEAIFNVKEGAVKATSTPKAEKKIEQPKAKKIVNEPNEEIVVPMQDFN